MKGTNSGAGETKLDQQAANVEWNESDVRIVEYNVVMHFILFPTPPTSSPALPNTPSTPATSEPPNTTETTTPTSNPEESAPSSTSSEASNTQQNSFIPAVFITRTRTVQDCESILAQLGKLVWILIVHHTGYPELYANLVALLNNCVAPPSDSEARAVSTRQ